MRYSLLTYSRISTSRIMSTFGSTTDLSVLQVSWQWSGASQGSPAQNIRERLSRKCICHTRETRLRDGRAAGRILLRQMTTFLADCNWCGLHHARLSMINVPHRRSCTSSAGIVRLPAQTLPAQRGVVRRSVIKDLEITTVGAILIQTNHYLLAATRTTTPFDLVQPAVAASYIALGILPFQGVLPGAYRMAFLFPDSST